MKLPKLSELQIVTTKRLVWLAVSYFLSGMALSGVAGLDWWKAGAVGAGAAILRVSVAMTKSAAYHKEGKLTEAEADRIIKQAIDQATPQPGEVKK